MIYNKYNELYSAGQEIRDFCVKYARLNGDLKMKYDNLCFYPSFWHGQLHELMYPGYHYRQCPQKLWSFDIWVISKFTQRTGLVRLGQWWQGKVYGWAYKRALNKYPHLCEEIMWSCDYPELLGVKK